MATGDVIVGLDGKLLYGTAGSTATTEIVNAEDVTLNLGTVEVDTTRRGSTWETGKPVLNNAEITFTLQKREGDAARSALMTAFLNRTRIALYGRELATGAGLNADFYITGFNDSQPLKDKQTIEVTAKLTDELRAPVWA